MCCLEKIKTIENNLKSKLKKHQKFHHLEKTLLSFGKSISPFSPCIFL